MHVVSLLRRSRLPLLAFGCAVCLVFRQAPAQVTVTQILANLNQAATISVPNAVYVDVYGNLFYINSTGTAVSEVPANGGPTINYPTVLKNAEGVAADKSGNVYISQLAVSTILKIAPNGTTSTIGSGLENAYQMAIDSAQNLYVVDNSANKAYKIPTIGSGAQTTLAFTGLNEPRGIAVDAAGDIFVTNYSASAPTVMELPANGGPQINYSLMISGSAVPNPWGIAVDSAGDLYIEAQGATELLEYPVPVATSTPIVLASVGGSGLSVQVDPRQEPVYMDSGGLFVVQNTAGNFYGIPVGSTSKAMAITYTFATADTLATVPAVFTSNNSATVQFKDAVSGDSCTTKKAIAAGGTCVLNVEFAPTQEGVVTGTVSLMDSAGKTVATTYLTGVGDGPVAAFGPGTQSTLASGLGTPEGVAVDSAGNTYFADATKDTVTKITSAGSSSTLGFTGLTRPFGVAVDGAGTVYVSDSVNNAVYKLTTAGVQSTVTTTGLSAPKGIALDGLNNLYIADSGNKRVVRIDASGNQTVPAFTGLAGPTWVAADPGGDVYVSDTGTIYELPVASAQMTTAPSGLSAAAGIAVSANGTLFVADSGNGDVLAVPTTGPSFTLAGGLTAAAGVAIAPNGSLSVTDSGGAKVVFVDRTKDTIAFPATASGTTSAPLTASVQNAGNVALNFSALSVSSSYALESPALATDCTASTVLAASAVCNVDVVFSPATLGTLNGTATLTDNALNTAGTVQTVNLTGLGVTGTATTLSASNTSPVYGTPFNIVAKVAPNSGSTAFSSADTVTFTVDGVKTNETLSGGTATFPTPSGFAAGQHTITATFNGDSNYATSTSTTFTITVAPYPLTVSAVAQTRAYGVANAAFVATYATFQYNDTAAVLTGAPSFSTTAQTNSDPATYPITVSVGTLSAANYTFVTAPSTITVTQAASTINFSAFNPGTYVYGNPPLTPSATSNSTVPIVYSVVSGHATVTGTGAGQAINITGIGTVVIAANQAGNTDYAAATQVTQSFTVTPAVITVTAQNVSITQGSAIPALTATYSGFQYADTQSVVSGAPALSTTATSSSPTGSYPIGCATGTLAATNYTFACVNGTLTITGTTPQTITFPALGSITYGQAPPALSASAAPSGLTVTYAVASGPATVGAGNLLTVTGIGKVCVTASQAGNGTYAAATSVTNCFTVSAATLTVTPTSFTINYGAAIPTLTYTITGEVNGDGPGVISGVPGLSTTAALNSPVAAYPITATQGNLAAANYIFAFNTGTLTIVADPQSITFGALSNVTYGAAPIALTATASSGLAVTYNVTTAATASVSGPVLTILGAGQVCVVASQAGNATTAAATPVTQCFTVSPAPLTVTAGNLTVPYGQALPATFAYTITGFVYSDSQASATAGAPAFTTNTGTTTPVPGGTYTITPALGTLTAANYLFSSFVNGVLTVSADTQTILFAALPNIPQTVTSVTPGASASSGLAVVYSVTGPASVNSTNPSAINITGPGTVCVTANQPGNSSWLAAAPVTQCFNVTGNTSTALTLSATSIDTGGSVTFSATVTGAISGKNPSGTVSFYYVPSSPSGATAVLIGSGTLKAVSGSTTASSTTYSSTALPSGTLKITAVYSGDTNFSTSTSAATTILVIPQGYTVSESSDNLTIAAGQSGTTTITITPIGGYSYVLNFACGSLPSNLTCSFNPPAVSFYATSGPQTLPQSTVLTIAAAANSGSARPLQLPWPSSRGTTLAALLLGFPLFAVSLIFGGKKGRRNLHRKLRPLALLLVAFGGFVALSGCGTAAGPSSRTYNIPVVLTDGTGVTPNVTITVTVTD